jgi:hypothetical protein
VFPTAAYALRKEIRDCQTLHGNGPAKSDAANVSAAKVWAHLPN